MSREREILTKLNAVDSKLDKVLKYFDSETAKREKIGIGTASEIIGKSVNVVRDLIAKGEIPCTKGANGRYIFNRSDIIKIAISIPS